MAYFPCLKKIDGSFASRSYCVKSVHAHTKCVFYCYVNYCLNGHKYVHGFAQKHASSSPVTNLSICTVYALVYISKPSIMSSSKGITAIMTQDTNTTVEVLTVKLKLIVYETLH